MINSININAANNFPQKTSCSNIQNNDNKPDYDMKSGHVPCDKLGSLTSCIKKNDLTNSAILKKLEQIEKENNIKIICAVEAGSRAWGSNSQNSDYDVRFVYVCPKKEYSKENRKDNLQYGINDSIDLYGYDLSKVINMAKESKYTIYEWLNSPVKYVFSPETEKLQDIINTCTDKNNLANSYLNLTKSNFKLNSKKEKQSLKLYLLNLKTLLMAEYILNTNELPPLNYKKIFDTQLKDEQEIKQIAKTLLDMKKTEASFEDKNMQVLDDFIKNKITKLEQELSKNQNNVEKGDSNKLAQTLDTYFQDVINSPDFAEINVKQPNPCYEKRVLDFPEDVKYRKQLLKSMGLDSKDDELLSSILGFEEFTSIIQKHDKNPNVYSVNSKTDPKTGKVTLENVINKNFKANLHMHTNNSDGKYSTKELLDAAAKYASSAASKNKDDTPFVIAITDHNTMEGCREALEIIAKNPDKYKNLRVVLGTELSAKEKFSDDNTTKNSCTVHLLAQCVNPFDEKTNAKFDEIKNGKTNPNYANLGNFAEIADLLSKQDSCIVGYAHPFSHQSSKISSEELLLRVGTLIEKFKKDFGKKAYFIENYYQSYEPYIIDKIDFPELQNKIEKLSNDLGLISTGGLDTHGKSIFYK